MSHSYRQMHLMNTTDPSNTDRARTSNNPTKRGKLYGDQIPIELLQFFLLCDQLNVGYTTLLPALLTVSVEYCRIRRITAPKQNTYN